MITPQLYRRIMDERGRACEVCGTSKNLQLNHCLFHRLDSKPELDVKENIEVACASCHEYANSYEHRCWFWQRQCERYGADHMREWHRELPMKVKERFE